MSQKRVSPRRWVLWLAVLLIAFAASALEWGAGAKQAASAEEHWTKVALLYSSDCKGKLEPCG